MLDARKARRARGGDQAINTSNTFTTELEPDDPLFQEIVQAQGPMPVGEAVVAEKFEPRNREERKVYRNLGVQGVLDLREMQNKVREDRGALARGVAEGATSGAFEAARMAPVLGEIIDGAEIAYASQTGKDFYDEDASAAELGAIMGAGLIVPNIIERPLKKIGKAAKKFFKIGKKADSNLPTVSDIPREPSVNDADASSLPFRDDSGNFVDRHPMKIRTPDVRDTKGLPTYSDQSGVQFVRDWYSDPKVQQHFRGVTDSRYTGRKNNELFQDVYNDFTDNYIARAETDLIDVGGQIYRYRSADPEINSILSKINALNMAAEAVDRDFTEAEVQQVGKLWDMVASRQGEISKNIIQELEDKYGKEVVAQVKNTNFKEGDPSIYALTSKDLQEEGSELEKVFLRGRTTPDILADFENKDFRKVVSKDAGGVSNSRVTALNALDDQGQELNEAWRREWAASTAAHEANHDATATFIRGKSPEAVKIREGLSLAVKPEFRGLVETGSHRGLSDGDEYYASAAELTARAMEMRRNVIKTVQDYASGNLQGLSENAILRARQISSAFGGKMPSEEQVFKFVTGDHEGLTLAQKNSLLGASLGDKSTLSIVYDKVLAGEPGPNMGLEKLESFRNLMKFGLMATGAAGAYGALDNQGGQPSNSMYAGGVITMRKKRKGMSTIRK